ncbi:MAG: tetratricopeptide repeat protein [Ignavibacteria bacterium]|nr:tetratricopeptide repeat protein [Ignavibacteria bacterium]
MLALILQAQKGKSSLRSQADRALSERKYEEAIAKYTALIDKLPRDPYAYIGRAKAFQGLRDCESSMRDCRSGLALNPRNVDACTVLGNCFNNSSKYDSAYKAFRTAISIDSSVAMSWRCLGLVEYNMGRRVEAIRSKTRAWLLDTADMEMLVSRADYRYYADSFLLAKQDYERALLSNRGLSHARYGRARCCSAMGLYSRQSQITELPLLLTQVLLIALVLLEAVRRPMSKQGCIV